MPEMADLGLKTTRVGSHGQIALFTIDRPNKGNAYTGAILRQLEEAIRQASQAVEVRGGIVTGSGQRSFCAGGDLQELSVRRDIDALDLSSRRVFDALAHAPWPTIAAINGPAVGGGVELALACDLRISAPHVRFSLPEPRLGIIPAAGGLGRLAAAIGMSRAKEIVLFGRELDAPTALEWGLISRIEEDPLEAAIASAERAAACDPLALRMAKLALGSTHESTSRDLETVIQALLYGRRVTQGARER